MVVAVNVNMLDYPLLTIEFAYKSAYMLELFTARK